MDPQKPLERHEVVPSTSVQPEQVGSPVSQEITKPEIPSEITSTHQIHTPDNSQAIEGIKQSIESVPGHEITKPVSKDESKMTPEAMQAYVNGGREVTSLMHASGLVSALNEANKIEVQNDS